MKYFLRIAISAAALLTSGICTASEQLAVDDLLAFLDTTATAATSHYEQAHASRSSSMQYSQMLLEKMNQVNADIQTLVEEQSSVVEMMIRQQNEAAIHALMDKLASIETLELQRRDNAAYLEASQQQIQSAGLSEMTEEQRLVVQEMLDPYAILSASDERLQQWCSEQILTATEGLQANATAALATVVTAVQQDEATLALQEACVRMDEAASTVLHHLVTYSRDGIGMYDHAPDGSIVHQYTSSTYTPPSATVTMNLSWWQRFVPQDWERLLPSGWQEWAVPVPTSLLHTMGWNRGVGPAPPETVLHPSVVPGSCWPMAGSSGSVMIRLANPVKITAVSVEHASSLLLDNTKRDVFGSAPKHIQVYGLSACQDRCDGLGFDRKQPVLIATIVFDVKSGGVQTFPVNSSASSEGSCEVEASTCSAPLITNAPSGIFSGIVFEVQDNYGNDSYTCLYRLRVHGDIAEPSS